MLLRHLRSTLFPYTTLFRSIEPSPLGAVRWRPCRYFGGASEPSCLLVFAGLNRLHGLHGRVLVIVHHVSRHEMENPLDRKSTRLNSSHLGISYAVFCLKKKN